MPPETTEPIDLLDLKLLPAWVKEAPETKDYSQYEGEAAAGERPRRAGGPRDRPDRNRKRPTSNAQRPTSKSERRPNRQERGRRPPGGRDRAPDRHRQDRHPPVEQKPLEIAVRFVPHPPALDSVTTQIKADALAFSLFSLARLFLQKPERYDVHLAAKSGSALFQLGENDAISADKQYLEHNAFRFTQKDFYKIDISQTEPIKGNFTSVARDRLSGTLLGPTNHHAYQARLRTLYEQRFSRRMSFPDYQRQIEIVSDPALVEQWKEDARTATTFTTLREETPLSLNNAAEAEKHFRATYLPNLVRTVEETTIDGVTSRNLGERTLRKFIEDAWSAQNRSPSQMMAELSNRFREGGLHIFRHRKGMLFVTPIRVRPFKHEETSVSVQVRAILDAVGAHPRIVRKDLAEKLLGDVATADAEARKLSLASDLRWLISEGYVIEFNDGSLDLPRVKVKPVEVATAVVPTAEPMEQAVVPESVPTIEETEIGAS